jgi:hypothetical protein
MRRNHSVRPINHAMSVDNPSLYTLNSVSPSVLNCRFDQNSLKKRWGYTLDRSPLSKVYEIVLFNTVSGSRYSLYLTDTDLVCKETGTGGTFSYKTATHTTSTVASIAAPALTAVTGTAGTLWVAGGIAAGDKFIIDTDHDADSEIDSNWATVATVGAAETALTLSSAYTGATTTGPVAYKIRKVYSVPANERWSWAIVGDKFCFGNGNTVVQYWNGSGYATNLATGTDATYIVNARYMTEYANRLFLADVNLAGAARSAITIRWSKEGDPTNWTDSTAGELDLMDTSDIIMGLGKTGGSLIIFKPDATYIYSRTGVATDPISMTAYRQGVGCVAPYSPVSFMGTTAWVGRDDFYVMDGDMPVSIGEKIRVKFFDEVGESEIKRTWGAANHSINEVMWIAETTAGQSVFVYNYKYKEWYQYALPVSVTAFGRGAT